MKRPSSFPLPMFFLSLAALSSCGGRGETTAPPAAAVATVAITPSSNALLVGGSVALAATIKDASGNALTGRTVSWSSDAPGIATVTAAGVVTAVSPGAATITATSEAKSGTASVTVTAPVAPVATVMVSPASTPLLVGGSATLTVMLKDAAGNALTGRAVTWASDAQSIASVTSAGVVSAVAPGTATVTATSEGKSGTASVTVTAPLAQVATVTLTPAAAPLAPGGTVMLAVVLKDAAGNVLTGRAVSWASSAQAVATVTQAGVVTAVAPGAATITATSEGASGTAAITVGNPFNPTTSTTLVGSQRFTSVNIPVGVTVTAAGDLDLSASGPITIAGALTGNCVAMNVSADGAAAITGSISNACSDPLADGRDLTILGKAGVRVTGPTINSSGDIVLTNDLTLTDANFPLSAGALVTAAGGIRTGAAARAATGLAAAPDCAFGGVRPAPPAARAGAPSERQFLGGGAGKGLRMSCRGNGEIGGGGVAGAGATITAQAGGAGGAGTSVSNTFAEARAGDGATGGTLRVLVTGDLTISGVTNLISGDGGAGGTATATAQSNPALNKQPNAQATGGKGGDPGLVDIRAGGVLTIAAALNITIGRAGDGGSASATGASGLDATATSPAKEGGDANPTGGEGGGTPNRALTAFGAVGGATLVTVSGGRAGNAGGASGSAGPGGAGNETFPTGGNGGNLSFNTNAAGNGSSAKVGNGGSALLRNVAGAMFGRGGDGSVTTGVAGTGGAGWNDCNVPRKPGGTGGIGGSAAGRDGIGGTGVPNGAPGGITLYFVGNGGRGGNGQGPGAGGNGGSNATTSTVAKTVVQPSFATGVAGTTCPVIPIRVTLRADPNGHEPFVGYTGVSAVSVTTNGTTISISGGGPWVTVTGTLDANNNFVATGMGTVAGYANVPVSFTGSITRSGALSGVIQIGQTAQPTGLPNGPVTYNVGPGG